jgi:hypothetical protein
MKVPSLALPFSWLLLLAVSFAFADPLPPTSLSYVESAPRYTMGMGITINRPTVEGGQTDLVYSVPLGALPMGLTLGSTGNIYGIPLETGDFSPTIRVENGGGSAEVILGISVRGPTPVISYTPDVMSFPLNVAISTQSPVNTGGAVLSWSIAPNLTANTGLVFSPTTGRITGTPVYASSATPYTITATGFGGAQGQVMVSIAATAAAPTVTYDVGPHTLTAGSPMAPLSKTAATGNITHYSILPPLPAGLLFNTTTGRISGTPTTTALISPYMITAHGPAGTASDDILLEVLASAPDISYASPEYFLPVASEIAPIVPIKAGGPVTSWSIALGNNAQTLEANTGLRFNTTTGKITGTPTKVSSGIFYAVTAHGIGAAQDDFVLLIETTGVAPDISYALPEYSFPVASEIAPIVPVKGGGPITSWSIALGNNAQTLEANTGLRFNTTTGKITGAPTKVSSGIFYTITAHGIGVAQDAVTLLIETSAVAPTISYSGEEFEFPVAAEIAPMVPVKGGGPITSWSITPGNNGQTLEANTGLRFSTTTGKITGTPTKVSSGIFYTITAHGIGVAQDDAVLLISTTAAAPTVTYNPPDPLVLTLGLPMTPLVKQAATGIITSYSILPALPEGLALNTTTGAISGTPKTISISPYTVTAHGPGGTGNDIFMIFMVPVSPAISYEASPYSFVQGDAITSFRAVNTGGPIQSWAISAGTNGQSLAANTGLSFNPTTGRIFGTPSVLSEPQEYTVTANGWGNTMAQTALTIGVTPVPGKRAASIPDATSFRVSGGNAGYKLRLPAMDADVENITVTVTDLSGRVVWSRNVDPRAGIRAIAWDGKSSNGRAVSAGMYLARVTTMRADESAAQIGKGLKVEPK